MSLLLLPWSDAGSAQQTETPEEEIQAARAEVERDNPQKAIAMLNQLAADHPAISGIHRELGLAYYRAGQLENAKKSFERAIQENSQDGEAIQMEGLVLYRMGQLSTALPYLERARQWMPNANADANYVIGLCYLKAHRYDEARTSFAAQFKMPPGSAGAYLLLGDLLRELHQPEDSAVQIRKAIEISPGLPLAHFTLGELALSNADADLAIKEFEAERAVNPSYAPIYDRLGGIYLRLNRIEEAQQSLISSIALDQTNTEAFVKMGKVLLAKKDFATAIMYLRVAARLDPGDFVTHELLSQAYHRVGKGEEAKLEADTAAKLHAERQPRMSSSKE